MHRMPSHSRSIKMLAKIGSKEMVGKYYPILAKQWRKECSHKTRGIWPTTFSFRVTRQELAKLEMCKYFDLAVPFLGLYREENKWWHICVMLFPAVAFFFFTFIYFLRDRAQVRGVVEKEGVIESKAGSRLRAVSTETDAGLQLTNHEIMTWAKSDT